MKKMQSNFSPQAIQKNVFLQYYTQTYTLFQMLHISWQEVISQILGGFKIRAKWFSTKYF